MSLIATQMLTANTPGDTVSPGLCQVSKETLLMVKDTRSRWQAWEFCEGSSLIAACPLSPASTWGPGWGGRQGQRAVGLCEEGAQKGRAETISPSGRGLQGGQLAAVLVSPGWGPPAPGQGWPRCSNCGERAAAGAVLQSTAISMATHPPWTDVGFHPAAGSHPRSSCSWIPGQGEGVPWVCPTGGDALGAVLGGTVGSEFGLQAGQPTPSLTPSLWEHRCFQRAIVLGETQPRAPLGAPASRSGARHAACLPTSILPLAKGLLPPSHAPCLVPDFGTRPPPSEAQHPAQHPGSTRLSPAPPPGPSPRPWLRCVRAAWRRFRPHAWFPWQPQLKLH